MKRQSGFTLIELLLVLAIIGVISAIAIPALLGQRENAKRKSTEATAQSLVSEMVSAAKLQTVSGTAGVIAYVIAEQNFIYPSCKNAYTPTQTAVVAGNAANNGDVGYVAAVANDINLQPHNVINVSFKHAASGPAADGTTFTLLSQVPVE